MIKENIVLIGFMGSGKSVVGRLLAEKMGRNHQDLDRLLEEKTGATIADIFRTEGETGFREKETALLKELVRENGNDSCRRQTVYSAGGGAPLVPENRVLLKKLGKVVWLDVSAGEVLKRVGEDETRPLLQGEDREEKIRHLMAERKELYSSTAELKVDGNGEPAQIAEKIKEILNDPEERKN